MNLTNQSKNLLIITACMMALSVAIGAFGAHGLKAILSEPLLKIYNTGVSYQFYNTLGLFAIALTHNFVPNSKKVILAGYMLFIGTLIFSFSLYLLVLLQIGWLGAITPIGGTLMIISWIMFVYGLIKDNKLDNN